MGSFTHRSGFVVKSAAGCALVLGCLVAAGVANAQELITNGSFAGGLSGWTQASWAGGSLFGINANGPTNTSAATGDYAYAGGGAYNVLQQDVTLTTGSAYRLTYLAGSKSGQGSTFGLLSLRQESLSNYNAASFDYRPSDAVFGSYTVDFVADTTTVGVWLRNDGGGYAAYDSVSLTPIPSVQNAMNYTSASGYSEITTALTGSGKVTSNAGTGGLTLGGANTYTGGTEVTGGNLYVVGVGTLGAAGASVTVSGAGQLDLRNQQIRTGTIAMIGQDARILAGDVNNPGSIVNNGVFQFGGGLVSVPVSGSGSFNVTGGGSITGSNSYSGPTTISATPGWYGTNTLYVDNASALGSAAGDLTISGGIVSLQNNTVTRTGNVAITGGIVHTGTFSKASGAYDVQGGQIDAVLAGLAGLTKSGTGVAVLYGNNSYSGSTAVDVGALLVNGAHSGSGTVTVANAAGLGGDGSLAGNLVMAAGAFLVFDPLATLEVAGSVTLDNSFAVASLRNADGSAINWASIADGTYTLIGTTASTFNTISNFGAVNAASIGDGRSAYFQNGSLQLVIVPEPSSLALLGGLATLVVVRQFRRRR